MINLFLLFILILKPKTVDTYTEKESEIIIIDTSFKKVDLYQVSYKHLNSSIIYQVHGSENCLSKVSYSVGSEYKVKAFLNDQTNLFKQFKNLCDLSASIVYYKNKQSIL